MSARTSDPIERLAERVPLNDSGRFAHIDAVRCFAILAVVLYHAGAPILDLGDAGVTVFFAVSGFVITWIVMRERERTGGFRVARFYANRAFKLVPPLLVAVVLPTLIFSIFSPVHWKAFVAQLLFSYNWVLVLGPSYAGPVLPGTTVLWTLAVEEQFYIVFAIIWLALLKTTRWRLALLVMGAILIISIQVTRFLLHEDSAQVAHLLRGTDIRADAILIGMLAAVLYSLRPRLLEVAGSGWTLLLAAILFTGSLIGTEPVNLYLLSPTMQAVSSVLVMLYGMYPRPHVIKTVFHRVSGWRPVQVVGLASYSIYLVHDSTGAVVDLAHGHLPDLVLSACRVVIGIAFGLALYASIEVPVRRWRVAKRRP